RAQQARERCRAAAHGRAHVTGATRRVGLDRALLLLGVLLLTAAAVHAYSRQIASTYSLSGARSPRVDLNRDARERIELLPGGGPSLARRIVAERDAHGRFAGLDDLVARVDGVGARTRLALAELVFFGE